VNHRGWVGWGLCSAILALSLGAAHGQDPQAGEQVATEPAADEVFVFERHAFDGPMLRLQVGTDAMLIIYSWYRFSHVCLGMAGVNAGGSGRYSDLSRLKAANPIHLDDRARSLRVVAKGTDLRRLCR
jgi:hypothetical protein